MAHGGLAGFGYRFGYRFGYHPLQCPHPHVVNVDGAASWRLPQCQHQVVERGDGRGEGVSLIQPASFEISKARQPAGHIRQYTVHAGGGDERVEAVSLIQPAAFEPSKARQPAGHIRQYTRW
jgi:hypothetical protein